MHLHELTLSIICDYILLTLISLFLVQIKLTMFHNSIGCGFNLFVELHAPNLIRETKH